MVNNNKKNFLVDIGNASSQQLAAFDCGVKNINIFLTEKAKKDSDENICGTQLIISPGSKTRILAFYSLSAAKIEAQIKNTVDNLHLFKEYEQFAVDNPDAQIYDPNNERYIFPVISLDFLAVDKSIQKKGLGSLLLQLVFKKALSMRESGLGFMGIKTEALYDAKDFYSSRLFKYIDENPDNVQANFCPKTCPMLARIDDIKETISNL
ncbi:GNAT family N-acetyltransferase [Oenococcus oeni]|uniref:GNAT family N-acetyltransferase n=1 Tax=Oenococcus oeni TaxID=1247 RepID=UPI0010B3D23C|nr:GNAT family N-acetyltransferase [Oenococcus oeni]SYW13323.1 hypothetical protein OENI_1160002 [Oenococcus oeni]